MAKDIVQRLKASRINLAEATTKRGRYGGVVLVAGDRGKYRQQNRFSGPTGPVGGPGGPL